MPAIQDALLAAGAALLQAGSLLAVAPLLKTVIKKMKARLQNRQGPPLLQGYYDLAKLLRKEPVRSDVASWVYVAGPRVYFAAAVAATRNAGLGAFRPRHGRVGHRESLRGHGRQP
jgi:formate hydrogenlyase subunit 4